MGDLFARCVWLCVTKGYKEGVKAVQMLRDICAWLNINSMRAEKVRQFCFWP